MPLTPLVKMTTAERPFGGTGRHGRENQRGYEWRSARARYAAPPTRAMRWRRFMRPPARPAGLGTISAFNERHFRASVDGSLQRNIHILYEVRWKIKLGHDI